MQNNYFKTSKNEKVTSNLAWRITSGSLSVKKSWTTQFSIPSMLQRKSLQNLNHVKISSKFATQSHELTGGRSDRPRHFSCKCHRIWTNIFMLVHTSLQRALTCSRLFIKSRNLWFSEKGDLEVRDNICYSLLIF